MKTYIHLIFALTILLSGSCTHYYYAPNSPNIPLLKGKGDGNISAGYTAGEYMNASEVQASYALTDKHSMLLNSYFIRTNNDDGIRRATANYAEIGLGRYYRVADEYTFECYGGVGGGQVRNIYSDGKGFSDVSVQKAFIQPTFGRKGRVFDFGFSSRIAMVDLGWTKDGTIGRTNNDLQYLDEKTLFWRFEPGVKIGLGYKNLKFYGSLNFSLAMNNPDLAQERTVGSIGVIVSLK